MQSQTAQLDKISKVKMDAKQAVEKATKFFSSGTFTKQLLTGTATGCISGMTVGLAARAAALTVGSSIILFEIAQHNNYTKQNWNTVQNFASQQVQKVNSDKAGPTVVKMRAFATKNKAFTAGFVGGFLFGIVF